MGTSHVVSWMTRRRVPSASLGFVQCLRSSLARSRLCEATLPASRGLTSWPAAGSCTRGTLHTIQGLLACFNSCRWSWYGGPFSHHGQSVFGSLLPRCAASQRATCARRPPVSLTALHRAYNLATTSPTRALGSPSSRSAAHASGPGSAGASSRAIGGGASARGRPSRGRWRCSGTVWYVCSIVL